jgi:VWFA-related protein
MTTRKWGKAIPIGLLAVSCATALRGQEAKPASPDSGHPITVETEMVRIPTIVTDKSGKPIPDLTVKDFAILENGRIQPIAYFEHVRSRPALLKLKEQGKDEVSNRYEANSGMLFILLLDMLNCSLTEQDRVRREAAKFLSETTASGEPVALMALNAHGLTVIHDFTTNPSELAAALRPVAGKLSMQESLPWVALSTLAPRHSPLAETSGVPALGQLPWDFAGGETELSLTSMREIGEAFAGIPGRKSLIWVTGGMKFRMDDRYVERILHLESLYQDTWKALNRADIAVYPKDVEDLVIGWSSVYDMEEFAQNTGGRMCYVRTEMDACFQEAVEDSSDYYVLGYYPEPDPKKKRWRKVGVQVDRYDAAVHARTNYFVGDKRVERATSLEQENLLLGLGSPLDYTDLPLTVRWTSITGLNVKKTVSFEYLLDPGATTVDDTDGNHISVEFTAMAVTKQGKIQDVFSKQIEGKLAPTAANNLKTTGGMFPGQMDLPSGDYQVRFVARDNLNGRMGSISTSLKVP